MALFICLLACLFVFNKILGRSSLLFDLLPSKHQRWREIFRELKDLAEFRVIKVLEYHELVEYPLFRCSPSLIQVIKK